MDAAPPAQKALILAPMLAFDAEGYRLGWGGGYYDRTIAALRTGGDPVVVVGVAYEGQRLAATPRDRHDEPLDWIVTEETATRIERQTGELKNMNVVVLGDVVGRSGRDGVLKHLPRIRERLCPDFIVVNGENAAHGFGITRKICETFFDAGVDAITTGNHVWDQREIMNVIDDEPRLLRPINYPRRDSGADSRRFQDAGRPPES